MNMPYESDINCKLHSNRNIFEVNGSYLSYIRLQVISFIICLVKAVPPYLYYVLFIFFISSMIFPFSIFLIGFSQ